jgi:hypothetical protein
MHKLEAQSFCKGWRGCTQGLRPFFASLDRACTRNAGKFAHERPQPGVCTLHCWDAEHTSCLGVTLDTELRSFDDTRQQEVIRLNVFPQTSQVHIQLQDSKAAHQLVCRYDMLPCAGVHACTHLLLAPMHQYRQSVLSCLESLRHDSLWQSQASMTFFPPHGESCSSWYVAVRKATQAHMIHIHASGYT